MSDRLTLNTNLHGGAALPPTVTIGRATFGVLFDVAGLALDAATALEQMADMLEHDRGPLLADVIEGRELAAKIRALVIA